MSLRISCELTQDTVRRLFDQFFPVTVDLDPLGGEPHRRYVRLHRPSEIQFVAGRGLRVRASADLKWSAIGLPLPVTVQDLELMIVPAIATDERGAKLVFRPTLENADVKLLPSFVDSAIKRRVNAALAAEGDLLGWHFGESLGLRVPLPPNLTPVDAVHLAAGEATVTVSEEAIVTTLVLELSFSRQRDDVVPTTDE